MDAWQQYLGVGPEINCGGCILIREVMDVF